MPEYNNTIKSLLGKKKPKMWKPTVAEKSDEAANISMQDAMEFYVNKYKKTGSKDAKDNLKHIRDKYKKRFGK